jgi:hypothetical protein
MLGEIISKMHSDNLRNVRQTSKNMKTADNLVFQKRKGKFVNISSIIDPNFDNKDYANKNRYNKFINGNREFKNQSEWNTIKSNKKIRNGDIVFTGHTSEGKQEYGFGIVKDGNFVDGGDYFYGGGALNGVNALTKHHGFSARIDYNNAKKKIVKFGHDLYMFDN